MIRDKETKKIIKARRNNLMTQTKNVGTLINELKVTQADRILAKLMEENPDDIRLYELKSRIYCLRGDYVNAMKCLMRCDENHVFLKKALVAIKLNDMDILRNLYEKYFRNKAYIEEYDSPYDSNFVHFLAIRAYLTKIFEPEVAATVVSSVYLVNQTLNYSLDDAKQHIRERHMGTQSGTSTPFSPDFDLDHWMPIIKETIEANKDKAQLRKYREQYSIYFPNCGEDENKNPINHILVATVFNTSDIITMFPYKTTMHEHVLYLPSIAEEESPKELRKISRTERFNKRYGLN